jgi:hypothetical protein
MAHLEVTFGGPSRKVGELGSVDLGEHDTVTVRSAHGLVQVSLVPTSQVIVVKGKPQDTIIKFNEKAVV